MNNNFLFWLSSIWCIRIFEYCPICYSKDLVLQKNELFTEKELGDPPPDSLLEEIPTIPYSKKYQRILKNYSTSDIIRIKRILDGEIEFKGSDLDLYIQENKRAKEKKVFFNGNKCPGVKN